ncbi:MAG: flagellar biosynthesis anti-sigma factor FlgM [Firmicutes bacterium]|nr:flagellar biosynthesis anti-sigma factor FlgM [Bacillota bacterium]
MRVTGKTSSVKTTQGAGGVKPTTGAAPVSSTGGAGAVEDAVQVSGSAQFIAVAQARLAQIPEIRTEKVEALRAKLDADDYHPDGEAVAEGLVREHLPPRRDP